MSIRTIPEHPAPGERYARLSANGTYLVAVQGDRPGAARCLIADELDLGDALLLVFGGAAVEALAACEVSMDTAALHGVGKILPPAYRDSWAKNHTAAREVLAHFAPKEPSR